MKLKENTEFRFLLRFLKERGVYAQFVRNTTPQRLMLQCDTHPTFTIPIYIDQAFTWRMTPQGHEFWNGIYLEAQKVSQRLHELKRLNTHAYVSKLLWS